MNSLLALPLLYLILGCLVLLRLQPQYEERFTRMRVWQMAAAIVVGPYIVARAMLKVVRKGARS